MPSDSRTTVLSGSFRPINPPVPVRVQERDNGRPMSIEAVRQLLRVAMIQDLWWVDYEWWRPEPISRMYFKIVLSDGSTVTVFRDLLNGGWYRQNY